MKYQIDQSGKIENTHQNTVIAYANGRRYSILILKRLKRQVQEVFRLHGFTSLFIYYLFAVGVFYLIEGMQEENDLIIDLEYPGRDKIILTFLHDLLTKTYKPQHIIHFSRIGNRPPVHYAAKDVFDRKVSPNRILTLENVIEALKKTDGHLRECLSTLVDAQSRSLKRIYYKKTRKVKEEEGWIGILYMTFDDARFRPISQNALCSNAEFLKVAGYALGATRLS